MNPLTRTLCCRRRLWVIPMWWMGAALFGAVAEFMWANLGQTSLHGEYIMGWAAKVYHTAGTVLIGLTPMLVWLGRILLRHLKGERQANAADLDLGFIQRNAMLVGLAGTVIALIGSTSTLAREVSNGSATAVLKLIPVVGSALVSTLLGLLVAMGADLILHLRERQSIKATPSPESHDTHQQSEG